VQWLPWLLNELAPEVMNTACFKEYSILKLLDIDGNEGTTYICQVIEDYTCYITGYADDLRKKLFDQPGDNFISLRTLIGIVQ
jgi:hypothetical protein